MILIVKQLSFMDKDHLMNIIEAIDIEAYAEATNENRGHSYCLNIDAIVSILEIQMCYFSF